MNMKFNYIEIQRNNVTVNEFLTYVATSCLKKGMERGFSVTSPHREYLSSYSVVGDKKHCHFADYRTVTRLRRKMNSYELPGGFMRHYYTDEVEEYEETKLHRYDLIEDAADAPCKAEIFRQFAYNFQVYTLNWDGTCYNENCEFDFDDDKRGHGYYYQANVWNSED